VVKPDQGHLGEGVRLVRAGALPAMLKTMTDRARDSFVVQPYIEHSDLGGRSSEYRVLLFFGRLIYCARNRAAAPHAPLERIASMGGIIASNATGIGRRVRQLSEDSEVIRLGTEVARAFPELPAVAVDVIRSRDNGRLYVLEINSRGESWHLSSDFAVKSFDPEHRKAFYTQHDALNVVADALIEKTRGEAA
jgi:glutathione synthase/RimK-type ligase-like ATP-grasp enzyme